MITFLEINILWAAHQVHHSAEDYNLTTAMRQSMMQAFGNWVRYIKIYENVSPNWWCFSALLFAYGLFWSTTHPPDSA